MFIFIGILILLILFLIYLYYPNSESFENNKKRIDRIYNWCKTTPAKTYNKFRKDIENGNLPEYIACKKLITGNLDVESFYDKLI